MSTPPDTLVVTHTSTVTDDQIDDLGHMNVRYYGANAVAATRSYAETLGLPAPTLRSTYTRHHHEQMLGNQLEVRSGLLAGSSHLRMYHELRHRADGVLAATFVHELDHDTLDAPTVELPDHGRPRSLRLDTDAVATAPKLEELLERDLAIRKPRTVTTEDTEGADTVPTWLVNNLIWGGERIDDETEWIRTLPNGERQAFVVMESRVWIAAHGVPVGTPVQSFSATLEVGEKITREMCWSYDTSTGLPLVVLEGVDLCFNLTQRRSMVIPDATRERFAAEFFPEYAPG